MFDVIVGQQVLVDIVYREAGIAPVKLTRNAIAFSYYEQPTLSALLPASGPHVGGTRITITGSGFEAQHGGQEGNMHCVFVGENETIAVHATRSHQTGTSSIV